MSLVDLKIRCKNIVTSSDALSTIRRHIRSIKADRSFERTSKDYYNSMYPEKIRKYKGIHEGKRCFVIGNGPSLALEDLEAIKNEYSFAANRVYLIFEKTTWRPSYWMCQDRQLIRTLDDFYTSYGGEIFLGYQALHDFDINVEGANYYLCDNREVTRRNGIIQFSDSADKYIIDGASVTYSAIQLAVYMGFKEIYLLGVDHNFSHTLDKNRRIVEHAEVEQDYFDDRYKEAFKKFEEKGKTYAAPDSEMITSAFETAQNYGKVHEVKIYNATRGGKLEVFPRMSLEEVLSSKNNGTNEDAK